MKHFMRWCLLFCLAIAFVHRGRPRCRDETRRSAVFHGRNLFSKEWMLVACLLQPPALEALTERRKKASPLLFPSANEQDRLRGLLDVIR